ncbi:potassium channel family protein [Bacillus massiliigorillae]|uniref:potassium channel family protein n=1 Tax=Bacillus massiliigorillae TaxID=1243664 RepID=UPI0003A7A200|nr:potassium channel family protein [Bacillus massiliigorillae]
MISFLLTLKKFLSGLAHAFKSEESKILTFLIVMLLISGTFFYSSVEGFSYIDALYHSVLTLTTVGDSGLIVQTTFGKIFSIVYIFAGIGIMFGFLYNISAGIYKSYHEKDKEKESEEPKKSAQT